MAEPGKTEKATPKKKEEARKKGQVVRSIEVNSMLNVLVCLLMLKVTGEYLIGGLKMLSIYYWGNITTISLSSESIGSFLFFLVTRTTLLMLPLLIVVFMTGIISNVMQIGFLVTFEPLKPSFDKINPVSGFKRIFSKRLLFELLKTIVKIAVISYIFYTTVKKVFGEIFMTPLMDIDTYFNFASVTVYKLGMKIVIAFIIFAIIDYLWQKYDFEDNLMMTKQEVKDELRQLEGDPLIKSRIRTIQREMARKRMISEIPQADVVITNPTHVAVAIRYKEGKDHAPVMVAKGMNFMAEKIKEIARKNSVVIMENPPLARTLAKLEIGWEIPPELFQAVAEILAFVYQAKGKIKLEENPEKVHNNKSGRENYPDHGVEPYFTE